jgi:MYXO-CTERM domain-containing protein
MSLDQETPMTRTPAQRRRGLALRLAPLFVALGALPLMAPTCGSPGEGTKIFAQGSLIIPMEVCYQYQTDGDRSAYTPTSCPQAVDPGNVIRAYGLVYELIRNGVAVYWVINNGKSALTTVDLTVQYNGGFPVFAYDWSTDTATATPTASHAIDYRGGPFIVDGTDAARARTIMQQYRSTFQAVNVHVSNVAFQGYAKRTMAGGWSAGGTIPPKLALLNIGSSGASAKNSEVVIRGYLTQAGLDTPEAAGTASTGPHGQIYDHLEMSDFIPAPSTTTAAADMWKRTRLHLNGYQILWVPHWAAPSSCSDCPPSTSCTCADKYDPVTISSALKTIGAFVANGGDLFAECAGLGSFEGVFANAPTDTSAYSSVYTLASGLEPSTRFQTATSPRGFWHEENTPSGAAFRRPDWFSSPFMQLGDYPFIPHSGAISDYRAAAYDATAADSTVRLISETASDPAYDIFTIRPRTPSGSRGTIVYLGGHSYSGQDGRFQIAGTRLVLNTLFNLGATCTGDGVACNTGLLGVCAMGHYRCNASGQPECLPDVQPGTQPEVCNGLDDNCNGEIDEGLTNNDCYDLTGFVDPDGRTTTQVTANRNVGSCKSGTSSCVQKPDGSWGMSACVGQQLPAAEACNGLDDDCNGVPDDGLSQACYDGPAGTVNAGECKPGAQVCFDGAWGATTTTSLTSFVPGLCKGEVLPVPEVCGDAGGNGKDDNCNGTIDEGCTCQNGAQISCFPGPGRWDAGVCHTGIQTCVSGAWTACGGEDLVVASAEPEPCSTPAKPAPYEYVKADDWNCDGQTTQCTECADGQTRQCWGDHYDASAVSTLAGVGQCTWGHQLCRNGTWGALDPEGAFSTGYCAGYGHQSVGANDQPIEYCDNVDNNCNSSTDENAICPERYTCLNGVCVPAVCGVEMPAPDGYACNGSPTGQLVQAPCGGTGGPLCGAGQLCKFGSCVDPCPVSSTELDPVTLHSASLVCASGTSCGGGACIGGGCYEAGCAATSSTPLCRGGTCVANPCTGVSCPAGTFCRPDFTANAGFCVQACVFVTCAQGQRCGPDGFCVADPCANLTCNAGQRCTGGRCVADPCLTRACASGQYCDSSSGQAVCVDDPCTAMVCPAGVCVQGQCYASAIHASVGSAAQTSSSKKGCGCTSGTEAAWPALLGLLLAPLRRRRGRGGGAGRGGSGLALLLLAAATVAVAPGCKKSSSNSEIDLSQCAQTCGESRCVDLQTDSGHCGSCPHTCDAGNACAAGVCGPSGLVAPYIQSLSPSTGNKDDPARTVTVTGERFKAGATVRVLTNLGPRTLSCPATAGGDCQVVSATTLTMTLDLTDASEGPWPVRVVNPDNVISNASSFGIAIPVPSVTGVTPSALVAGTTGTLTVEGTGFTSRSTCVLWSQALGYLTPIAGSLGPAGLACPVDASTLDAGSYRVYVQSEKQVRSTSSAGFTISPSDPVVFSVTPDSATTAAPVTLTVLGDRFDSASQVLFDGAAVPTTVYFSSSQLAAGQVSLTYTTAGVHAISVRSGSGKESNSVAFSVGSSPPAIAGLTPPVAYQGDAAVSLVFTGTNFPSDAVIEVEPPGTTTFSTANVGATTVTGGTSASATYSLVRANDTSAPEGIYSVRLRYPSSQNTASGPWPLRVLSNQAILRDYDAWPTPNQGGAVGTTKTQLDFDVSNIRPGTLTIVFDSVPYTSAAHREFSPDPVPVTSLVRYTTGFDLTGLDAGTYAFTVRNPHNAVPSNALTFAITPGKPTLSSVCLVGGAGCTQQAVQQNTPVGIRLTGQNFADKDVSGNGSTVMIASEWSNNWPNGDPCDLNTITATQFQPAPVTSVTVLSSSEMLVWVDTRAAYADPTYGTTYYVGIWNPSDTGGLQKSSCIPGAFDPVQVTTARYLTAPQTPPAGTAEQRALPWFRVTTQ